MDGCIWDERGRGGGNVGGVDIIKIDDEFFCSGCTFRCTHTLSLSLFFCQAHYYCIHRCNLSRLCLWSSWGGGRSSVGLKLWKHSIRIRIWSVLAVVSNEVQRLTLFIGHISRTTTPPNKNVYISA